jgi:predicted metalloendopeptidase
MRKTAMATLITAAFVIGGCQPNTQLPPATESDSQTQAPAAQAELGTFGVDLTARDMNVKPGDNFFMYASGAWYNNFEMPADKTRFGAFDNLAERSNDQVKAIIEELSSKAELSGDEQRVAAFYNAYMDTKRLDELGLNPLQADLDKIAAIENVEQLTAAFGEAWLTGTSAPIGGGMGFNRTNPDEYQLQIGIGGLSLPDRDYYLVDSERFADIRTAFTAHVAQMLTFTGLPAEAAEKRAAQILALETAIAEIQWPRSKRRDRSLTLNPMTRDELETTYSDLNWDTLFASSGYVIPHVNVTQPDAVASMITLINDTDLSVWRDYLSYHLISNNASYLSSDIYNANFAFYGTKLNGQEEPRPRWKRAIAQMSGTSSLGFVIGNVYTSRHFPESSKAQMAELVENLRTALGERIDNLDWMGEETKVEALKKLAAFNPKIGYPDYEVDFAGLDIAADDLLGNIRNIRQFFQAKDVAKELKPTDKDEWFMVPQRVNAYYNPAFNEIVFPAAILQPPFFDPNADPAVNYGAIGAVIGHEMGHGFDDQGSKFDAEGVQRNWWTDGDRAAFDARTQMLIDQYSEYEPIPRNFVNGKNSLGENIGDVGGLAMAYHAYKLSLNGEEAPIIDGTTGDQRFFLAWAQVWKEKRTEKSMLNQLRGGTHSPGKYRALAPRNHDAWYEAFDVQPGDALYLAPEDRVRIW